MATIFRTEVNTITARIAPAYAAIFKAPWPDNGLFRQNEIQGVFWLAQKYAQMKEQPWFGKGAH